MAITQLAVGLKKQDFNDPGWHTGLNSGFDDADTRLRRTQAGNPNGVLQSHWIGQLCWDTTNKRLYVAPNVANPGACGGPNHCCVYCWADFLRCKWSNPSGCWQRQRRCND